VTFSLFLATFFQENDDQILAVVNAILPYQTTRLMESLGDFVRESTAISTVGLIILIVASVRLIFVVEGVFNAVWGAPRRRARLTRLILYTFALVALALVLGGIFWGLRALRRYVGWDSVLASPAFAAVAPFLLKTFFLTLLYRVLPNAKVRWLVAAVAGATVALALEVLRVCFSLYVETLSG
jgi:membrane protein